LADIGMMVLAALFKKSIAAAKKAYPR